MNPRFRRPRIFLGWAVVSTAVLISFSQVALFNPVLSVFIPEFELEFGWSRTEISLGVALGSLASAVFAPVIGPMIDRQGSRLILTAAAVAMSICLLSLGLMQSLWQFLIIFALGRGVAQGISNLAVSVTVSKWFIRQRGIAIGIAMLGTRFGFAILPISVQIIINGAGWREAAFTLAAGVAILTILPTMAWFHSTPESKGLTPDGDPPSSESQPRSRSQLEGEENWTRADAMRTRTYWLVTLAISLQFFAGGAVNLHMVPHFIDLGLSAQTAALVLSASAIFSAAGTMLEGILDMRIGTRKTAIIGFLGCALGMIILTGANSLGLGLLFAALYGTSFGLMVTSSQIIFAYYFGRRELGAIRGAALPLQMVTSASGPLIGGVAFDLTGSYLAAFVSFAFGYLIAALALVVSTRPKMPATQPAHT